MARRTVVKIGKMYTDRVWAEYLSVKTSGEWTPKELWSHLKTRYAFQNLAAK